MSEWHQILPEGLRLTTASLHVVAVPYELREAHT